MADAGTTDRDPTAKTAADAAVPADAIPPDGPARPADSSTNPDSGAVSCYQEGLAAITQDLLKADITMLSSTGFEMTYGGEEQGVYGSYYYTKNSLFPVAKTMYMVNHDMLGYVSTNKLEVSCGTAFAKETLTAACKKVSFCKLIQSDMTTEQGTDSDVFAAVKVPYTGLFAGYHDCYHDTPPRYRAMMPTMRAYPGGFWCLSLAVLCVGCSTTPMDRSCF
jgi:hypothetical protein